jgi:hypothetical protein
MKGYQKKCCGQIQLLYKPEDNMKNVSATSTGYGEADSYRFQH